MRNLFVITLLMAIVGGIFGLNTKVLKEGDLLFQQLDSEQSRALFYATGSKYTHVGILFRTGKKWWVFEAIGPVKVTSLKSFVSQGKRKHIVVKRLKNKFLKNLTKEKLKYAKDVVSRRYLGKGYDIYFGWGDRLIYCTELAWKLYRDVLGIELIKPEKMGDFNLKHPVVKALLTKRFGRNIPTNQKVISVNGLMESKKLLTIKTN